MKRRKNGKGKRHLSRDEIIFSGRASAFDRFVHPTQNQQVQLNMLPLLHIKTIETGTDTTDNWILLFSVLMSGYVMSRDVFNRDTSAYKRAAKALDVAWYTKLTQKKIAQANLEIVKDSLEEMMEIHKEASNGVIKKAMEYCYINFDKTLIEMLDGQPKTFRIED